MSEPIDPNVDFGRALQAAEERQRDTPPEDDVGGIDSGGPSPQPLEFEQGEEARPRDEQGRFTRREPDEEELPDELDRFRSSPLEDPYTPPAPETDTPADEQFERLYAGKYRTPEDMETAYGELEQRLGSQGDELGRLRQTVNQLMTQQAPQQQQPEQPLYTEDQIEDLVADPSVAGRFVQSLFDSQHPAARAALNKWAEYAPGDAMLFSSYQSARAAEARLRSEYDSQFAPLAAQQKQQDWLDAWAGMQSSYPDMGNFGQAMLEDLQANPSLSAPIQAGFPNAEQAVIENLYLRARARQQGQIVAAHEAQRDQQADMRRRAHVATGGSTPARSSGGPADAVQALKDSIRAYDRGQSVHDAIRRGREGS